MSYNYHDAVPPPKKRFIQSYAADSHNELPTNTSDGHPNVDHQLGATKMSSQAQNMMSKMGFTAGMGLGKHSQGITEPIVQNAVKGRVGLGMYSKGNEKVEPTFVWKEGDDPVSTDRQISWFYAAVDVELPSHELMKNEWMQVGERKLTLDDETTFVDDNILVEVLSSKSVFDSISSSQLVDARSKSNPYETIKNAIFMNRAALKVAEMDALMNFELSGADQRAQPLMFADICAGPGGFSEYFLWRRGKPLQVRGFGFTLKGSNDFKTEQITAGCPDCFYPYYGPDNDGDIFKERNLNGFRDFIMKETCDVGVHLVTGDGGFSVAGQENIQEILSKQLYLCQVLCALLILKSGGVFLTKLFDVFTPFSVGLIYLVHHVFDSVSLFKPATSRPANSERYLICRNYRRDRSQHLISYLEHVNHTLNTTHSDRDVQFLVPNETIMDNLDFYNYIVASNNQLGKEQIVALAKIKAFADDPTLMDMRQGEVRLNCLELWKIPTTSRSELPKLAPQQMLSDILKITNADQLLTLSKPTPTADDLISDKGYFPYEHKLIVSGGNKSDLTLVYSRGHGLLFEWSVSNRKWQRLNIFKKKVPLPRDSVFLIQVVDEYKPPKFQLKVQCMHIIDVVMIFGDNLMKKSLQERVEAIQMMCKCINVSSAVEYLRVRPPQLFRGYEFGQHSTLDKKLISRRIKGSKIGDREVFEMDDGCLFVPTGFFYFRITKDPWKITMKKPQLRLFYFDMYNKLPSSFSIPPDSMANYLENHQSRHWFPWQSDVTLDRQTLQKVVEDKIQFLLSK